MYRIHTLKLTQEGSFFVVSIIEVIKNSLVKIIVENLWSISTERDESFLEEIFVSFFDGFGFPEM